MFGKIKEKWNGMSTTKKGVITIVGFMAVGALAKFAVYKACENNNCDGENISEIERVAEVAKEETATTVEVGPSEEPQVIVIP